jgi:hypothetical protein
LDRWKREVDVHEPLHRPEELEQRGNRRRYEREPEAESILHDKCWTVTADRNLNEVILNAVERIHELHGIPCCVCGIRGVKKATWLPTKVEETAKLSILIQEVVDLAHCRGSALHDL